MLMGSIYFGTITKDTGRQNAEEKKEANKKKELLVKAILRQEQIF